MANALQLPKRALLIAAWCAAGCGPGSAARPAGTASAAAPNAGRAGPAVGTAKKQVPVSLQAVGLDASALDRSADPCRDFYQFACGGWLQKAEIPPDKPRWLRSFNEIHERNEADLRRILEAAAQEPGSDPVLQKIGSFYGACMDEPGIERAGLKPIQPLLAKARAVGGDSRSITNLLTELHRVGIWALFDISAEQDFKDATRYIAYLDQNGLGLPDRDYYLNEDAKSKELRIQYQAHVARMLRLSGMAQAAAGAAALQILKLETELAKISKTRVERRDPKGLYNKVDRAGLEKTAPRVDWKSYFAGLGRPDISDINLTSVPFFEGMNALMDSVKPGEWRNYFQWHVLRATAHSLPKAFVDESFSMEQALTGQKEQRARWKRCVQSADIALGELVAQPFVKERFSGASKPAAERMVREISEAFGRELSKLSWMDDATRRRAEDKRNSMAFLIGYPDKWRRYDFDVTKTAHAQNAMAAQRFELSRQLRKIGQPVDRAEWEMTPPTVNAYYTPLKNQMVFPAGILQPPFYSVGASVAVNLGAMGMVVGHELTHGFDDQGSQFDDEGNLTDWWSSRVKSQFVAKTSCVDSQYSAYEALPGVRVNGKLTLGENIADMGGVKLAFQAYRAIRAAAPETTVADGFTEDQQFFLATGQIWCSKYRDEYARMATQVDPHSPPRFRVNGSLANLPQFAEAFACKPGTPMSPKTACAVW
jgi:putative endopeptidase